MNKAARLKFYSGTPFSFLGVDAEYHGAMELLVIRDVNQHIVLTDSIIEDDDNSGFSFNINIFGYENHLKMKFGALDFKQD